MNRLLVFLIILIVSKAAAMESRIVRIGTLGDYPPYCIAEENHPINQIISLGKDAQRFKGLSWEIVRESYQSMGYTIMLSITPWVRTMRYLKENDVDVIFPTGKNKKRLKIYLYSKNSMNQARFLVYMERENSFRWEGLESLKNLRLGMIKGYNFGDRFTEFNFDTFYLNSIAHGFRMLDRKRIEGFLGYEDNWDYYLKHKKIRSRYKKLPVFDSSPEFLAAIKKRENTKTFITDFDKGFEIIEKNGKLDSIRKKWLEN